MPMNPATPVTSTCITAACRRACESARSFTYLRKLAKAPMAMCAKPGGAVEEAELHHVEAQEAGERRERDARRARPLAPRMHRLGLHAWCSGSAWRCRRRSTRPSMQEVAREPRDGSVARRPSRAPGRRSSVRAGGRRGARSSPDSLRRARASGRGTGCGARARTRSRRACPCANAAAMACASAGRHALVGVEAQHPVVRGLAHREVLLRAEAQERLLDHARAQRAAPALRYHRCCPNRPRPPPPRTARRRGIPPARGRRRG